LLCEIAFMAEKREHKDHPTSSIEAAREKRSEQDTLLETPCACQITVDKERIEYDISSVELRQYIDKHHVLRLSIRERAEDTTRDITAYSAVLGKSLSLNIQPAGGVVNESRALTFVGVVTKVAQSSSIDAINVTTIEAHSPTVSIDGARHNAFFRDQSRSDIIGAIVRNYPITVGTIDSSGDSLKFYVQHRETDYEFVMRLASGAGLFAHYDGQEFGAIKATSSGAEPLVWRETLGAFAMCLGTAPQEFTAQVYNYEQAKSYTQDTKSVRSTASLSALSQSSPDASKKIYRDSGFSTSPRVVADARSLDKILERDRARSMGQMITCEGQTNVPALKVGKCVQVRGLDKLDGHYLVDSIVHRVNATGGYHNRFTGRPLDIAFPARYSTVPSATHLQTATVVDNNDPDKFGRIKVKFPWLEAEETIWVRFLTPHAGQDRGWYAVPEIGDEVLVGYEFGNPNHPIALGALYNKDAAPPGSAPTPENDIKLFRTKAGNEIKINDKSGSEEIAITTKDGDNKVVLNMSGPSITIESKGDISIKGSNILIESDQKIKLKAGTDADIEAGANLKTKASAQYNAEGAMVTVKGNPINLN
jgi:type VI secretion system secreted protein VgrG